MSMYEDIDWRSGMLIKPQHMQLIKQHNFYKVMYLLRMTMPHYWGIIELTYDTALLHEKKIIINTVRYVSKDGALVDYHHENDGVVSFVNLDDTEDGEFYIFLANTSINYKGVKQSERHHKINVGPIEDINSIEPSDHISFILVKPEFLKKDELLPKHTYFPLIKFRKIMGEITIVSYTPPSIFLTQTSPIIENIKKVLKKIDDKLHYAREKITADSHSNMLDSKIMNTIRTYDLTFPSLVRLKTLLDKEYISPYEIYNEILNLLTCTYTASNSNKLTINKYDHNNIETVFDHMLSKISNLWNTLLQEAVLFATMNTNDDGYCRIIESGMIVDNKIHIQCELVDVEFNLTQVRDEITRFAICSKSHKDAVCSMRIRGIKPSIISNIRRIQTFNELFNIENAVYFSIDINSEYFTPNEELLVMTSIPNKSKYKISIIYPAQTSQS